jgi:hypothetical protein
MNTDKTTENILSLNLTFQQVVLVNIGTTIVAPTLMKSAANNQPTQPTNNETAAFTSAKAAGLNPAGHTIGVN